LTEGIKDMKFMVTSEMYHMSSST